MTRHELGRRAELAVSDYLFVEGFDVLARNVRVGAYEIDVVARRGPLAVAAEVRTRGATSFVGPFASVGWRKRRTLRFAVDRLWRRSLSRMCGVERVRIDVAAVTFRGRETLVDYAEDALGAFASQS
jgi:putative endonuclease